MEVSKQIQHFLETILPETPEDCINMSLQQRRVHSLVKPIRSTTDSEYEFMDSLTNNRLVPDLQCIALLGLQVSQEDLWAHLTAIICLSQWKQVTCGHCGAKVKDWTAKPSQLVQHNTVAGASKSLGKFHKLAVRYSNSFLEHLTFR